MINHYSKSYNYLKLIYLFFVGLFVCNFVYAQVCTKAPSNDDSYVEDKQDIGINLTNITEVECKNLEKYTQIRYYGDLPKDFNLNEQNIFSNKNGQSVCLGKGAPYLVFDSLVTSLNNDQRYWTYVYKQEEKTCNMFYSVYCDPAGNPHNPPPEGYDSSGHCDEVVVEKPYASCAVPALDTDYSLNKLRKEDGLNQIVELPVSKAICDQLKADYITDKLVRYYYNRPTYVTLTDDRKVKKGKTIPDDTFSMYEKDCASLLSVASQPYATFNSINYQNNTCKIDYEIYCDSLGPEGVCRKTEQVCQIAPQAGDELKPGNQIVKELSISASQECIFSEYSEYNQRENRDVINPQYPSYWPDGKSRFYFNINESSYFDDGFFLAKSNVDGEEVKLMITPSELQEYQKQCPSPKSLYIIAKNEYIATSIENRSCSVKYQVYCDQGGDPKKSDYNGACEATKLTFVLKEILESSYNPILQFLPELGLCESPPKETDILLTNDIKILAGIGDRTITLYEDGDPFTYKTEFCALNNNYYQADGKTRYYDISHFGINLGEAEPGIKKIDQNEISQYIEKCPSKAIYMILHSYKDKIEGDSSYEPCEAKYQFYCDTSGNPKTTPGYIGSCGGVPPPPPPLPELGLCDSPPKETDILLTNDIKRLAGIGNISKISAVLGDSLTPYTTPRKEPFCALNDNNYKADGKTRYYDISNFGINLGEAEPGIKKIDQNEISQYIEKCPSKAIYMILHSYKDMIKRRSSAEPCEATYQFYCDTSGNPKTTPGYIGSCGGVSVPPPLVLPNCGNSSVETVEGEECDLGSGMNNSSFGCTKECKKIPGYECTTNPEDYGKLEIEANELYNKLKEQQEMFKSKKCQAAYAGDPDDEKFCFLYDVSLKQFIELNRMLRVSCLKTTETDNILQQRPSADGKAQADYKVNCR